MVGGVGYPRAHFVGRSHLQGAALSSLPGAGEGAAGYRNALALAAWPWEVLPFSDLSLPSCLVRRGWTTSSRLFQTCHFMNMIKP